MSVRRDHRVGRHRLAAVAGAALLGAAALAGCSAVDGDSSVANPLSGDEPSQSPSAPAKPQVKLTTNRPRGNRPLRVETLLKVSAKDGTLDKVRFATQKGTAVPG